jgi:LmbE family N-acetylglucosaminyl deacetylase
MSTRRMMVVTAHPDDECLGFGGVLAKYAADGVETVLVTATRGQAGRYRGHAQGTAGHPGSDELARIRERELRAAAGVLGIARVIVLDYQDQRVDQADAAGAVSALSAAIRRARPDVVLTFAPDGAYGHPDHVAVSQMTAAAIVAAADREYGADVLRALAPHTVSKLYYLAWNAEAWAAFQRAFRKLVSVVDGVERQATPWADWSITTVIDTRSSWRTVWRAVSCHESQTAAYAGLAALGDDDHERLWGWQSFYRVFSLVNGGRQRETDLFEGIGGAAGREQQS